MFYKVHISLSKQTENHIHVIIQWEITAFKKEFHNYFFGNTLNCNSWKYGKEYFISEDFN